VAGRRTNIALFCALAVAFFTGWVAFATGTRVNRWIAILHGIAGFSIILLGPWKSTIARRGLARVRRGRLLSLLLVVPVAVALVSGVLHSTGAIIDLGSFSAMQLHVAAALATVPLALWHVIKRPARMRRKDLSRRHLLRAGGLLGASAAAYVAVETVARIASLPGANRRFTGSHERGSGVPGQMPVTQWLNDRVPVIDVDTWRLRAFGREWAYEELNGFDDRVEAVLDCTGGWFSQQEWSGVRLHRLISDPGEARSIVVRSLTGYNRAFPIEAASSLLVALRVGGRPLSPGHGYPVRVVAPEKRGFWWVKWVEEIRLSERPWWLQPPFPLT
jgi:hypothetical protein